MLGRPRSRGPFPGMHSPFARKGVWRHLPAHGPWSIDIRDGIPFLVDARGHDPLNHGTALERLRARWLAAWAPEGFEALLLLCQRLDSLHGGWHRDDELVRWGVSVLYGALPMPFHEERCGIVQATRQRAEAQLEMDLHGGLPGAREEDDSAA